MEYNEHNRPLDGNSNAINLVLAHLTQRQNEQSHTISDLRRDIELMAIRLDETEHMTSEEYGNQVVEQVMAAMPVIQAEAMKATKRQPTRR